jgi:hypothetical protein
MRILLATVVLATLLASSAYAQYGVWRGDYRAYAQVPPYAPYRTYGFYRSPYLHSVYDIRGRYLGSDLDPACTISCGEIPPRE